MGVQIAERDASAEVLGAGSPTLGGLQSSRSSGRRCPYVPFRGGLLPGRMVNQLVQRFGDHARDRSVAPLMPMASTSMQAALGIWPGWMYGC